MESNGFTHPNMEEFPMTVELSKEKDDDDGDKKDEKKESQDREHWSRHLDYLLSIVGYCVGLGNLWRFPYLCNKNGGGAFLIPFFFFLFVCGVPLFFLESVLGQFSGRSSYDVWEICPLFKGIGISMNVLSGCITVYYNTLMAWSIYYMIRSCASVLPWTTCSNPWNTADCIIRLGADVTSRNATLDTNVTIATNVTMVTSNLTVPWLNVSSFVPDANSSVGPQETVAHTSAEEFWQNEILKISAGVEDIGQVQWQTALCLAAAWTLVCVCVIKGVRSVGKAVYVTATLPYLLLTVLLVRGLMMDGSVDGIIFYLKPDFHKLLEVQVWLEAATQVFFSLGPAWGPLLTMASYNHFHVNCLRDAIVISCFCEGTSFFSGFVIFAMLGHMAKVANVPISEVVSSGPGLGFVVYPESLSTLPLPQFWSFLFFVMILIVGLDSVFGFVETYLTSLVDSFQGCLRNKRSLFTVVCCAVSYILSLLFATNGGIYLFQLIDWYLTPLTLFSVGTLECLVVGWFYGINRFDRDVEMMIGRPPPFILKILICFITPTIMFILLITTMAQYSPPTYGKYVYPKSGEIAGWVIQVLPFLPIPGYAVWEIWRREGPIKERFRQALRPSSKWQPAETSLQAEYRSTRLRRQLPFRPRLCRKLPCRK